MRRPAIAEDPFDFPEETEREPGWIIGFTTDTNGQTRALFEHGDGRISEKPLFQVQFTDWLRGFRAEQDDDPIAIEPGEKLIITFPDGERFVFIARGVVGGSDYQRIEVVKEEDTSDAKE